MRLCTKSSNSLTFLSLSLDKHLLNQRIMFIYWQIHIMTITGKINNDDKGHSQYLTAVKANTIKTKDYFKYTLYFYFLRKFRFENKFLAYWMLAILLLNEIYIFSPYTITAMYKYLNMTRNLFENVFRRLYLINYETYISNG